MPLYREIDVIGFTRRQVSKIPNKVYWENRVLKHKSIDLEMYFSYFVRAGSVSPVFSNG